MRRSTARTVRLKGAAGAPITMSTMHELEAELQEAIAALRALLASWPYAFAMAGGCNGGSEHPRLREVREENERLRARCRHLRARIAELSA